MPAFEPLPPTPADIGSGMTPCPSCNPDLLFAAYGRDGREVVVPDDCPVCGGRHEVTPAELADYLRETYSEDW